MTLTHYNILVSYLLDRAFPQSCECAENGKTDLNCDLFKCTCICDLRAGFCDFGCCCDPDCSADQVR
ncbi:DUF1619 domain-containing protein [archaeon]|nr:MAG: DUF1619 domain-containing protein [archaeon]